MYTTNNLVVKATVLMYELITLEVSSRTMSESLWQLLWSEYYEAIYYYDKMWGNTSFLLFCRSFIMDEKCLICESSSTCGSDVSRVTEKGWKSLLIASLTRRGRRDSIFRGRQTGVVVHVQCRKNYTRPADVHRSGRKSQASCSGTSSIRILNLMFSMYRVHWRCIWFKTEKVGCPPTS